MSDADEVSAAAHVIVAMGRGDAYPVLAGKRCEDWASLHPIGPSLTEAREARDEMGGRAEQLAASLGVMGR